MNTKKRLWIGPLVCLLALFAIFAGSVAGWRGGDPACAVHGNRIGSGITAWASTELAAGGPAVDGKVTMDVTYGYDNNAKGGRYVPIEVVLDNPASVEFRGTIQILTMESDYDVYRHDFPAVAAPGETSRIRLYLPLGNRADQMFVTLIDEEGRQAARKRVKLNLSLDVPELFVGVLSDTPESLSVWDSVGVNYGMLKSRVVHFDVQTFPEDEMGLDMLDVVLISDFRIRDLSQEQSQALIEWVRSGGVMILGTGMRVDDTLGRFAPELLEESYEAPQVEEIYMGMEYASDSPEEAMLEVPYVEFVLTGGNIIHEDDSKTLVAAANYSQGTIAVAGYDFVDIADFCHDNVNYVNFLLTEILGETKINELATATYSGDSDQYWSIRNMINTGNVRRLPNLGLYVMEIVIYVFLVSVGVFIFLKQRELTGLYRSSVVILSLFFTLIIYLMGSKTRFYDAFYTYAQFLETSYDTVSETTFMNIRSPHNEPYEAHLTADYSVKPVTRNYYYELGSVPRFTGSEDYRVAIEHQEDQTNVYLQDIPAFEPRYFRLDKMEENTEQIGFYGDIEVDRGIYTGSITSQFKEKMENCTVIMYDKLIYLGDMEPGETKELDGCPVLEYPRNHAYQVAAYLSGEYGFESADINNDEYLKAVEKSNLFVYYLENYMPSYTPNARVVGIRGVADSSRTFLKTASADGHTVVSSMVAVYASDDEVQYRSALVKAPKVVGGNYDEHYNSMYGMDPVTLEYSLGNDIRIERLLFDHVSEEFTDQSIGQLAVFDGNLYFYNHGSGIYDKMDMMKLEYDAGELAPYLSPGNTITVKYVHDNVSEYNWDVLLPMLNVVGRNTDVKD